MFIEKNAQNLEMIDKIFSGDIAVNTEVIKRP